MPTPIGIASGIAGIGTGISQMFGGGGKNPYDAGNKYLDQIPGKTNQYFDPYFQAGKGMLD